VRNKVGRGGRIEGLLFSADNVTVWRIEAVINWLTTRERSTSAVAHLFELMWWSGCKHDWTMKVYGIKLRDVVCVGQLLGAKYWA
jgi:hypothetical protein